MRHFSLFARRRPACLGARSNQSGYVLIFVMAALALTAFVAARFALRIDALREQALAMQAHAEARRVVEGAKARALYWVTTRPIGLASLGFADEEALRLDGRLYQMNEGVLARFQDARGLLTLNAPQRGRIVAMLMGAGASFDQANSMFDVLLDYTDADSLRRLNGAEAPDYAAAGLPPPRNDWVLSTDETARMMHWAANPELRARVQPWLSLSRIEHFNPNTAPLELLRLLWPKATAEQWERFDLLRRQAPFANGSAALAATGIGFDVADESLLFHASNELRLQLWAPGLPMALEYNLMILPTGDFAPWLIQEVRQSNRLAIPDAQEATAKFPDASKATARPPSSAMPDL